MLASRHRAITLELSSERILGCRIVRKAVDKDSLFGPTRLSTIKRNRAKMD